jgi:hypothetical protein
MMLVLMVIFALIMAVLSGAKRDGLVMVYMIGLWARLTFWEYGKHWKKPEQIAMKLYLRSGGATRSAAARSEGAGESAAEGSPQGCTCWSEALTGIDSNDWFRR